MCLDIGASTGGFTDVLLAHGAARVHAVDVGHGQLAWKLRSDPRVVVHERTNARYLTRGDDRPSRSRPWSATPASSGSPRCCRRRWRCAPPGAWAVALIKPQFEAGPGAVGGKGVVRDPAVHAGGLRAHRGHGGRRCRAGACWVDESPITGPEGNREFLIAAERVA